MKKTKGPWYFKFESEHQREFTIYNYDNEHLFNIHSYNEEIVNLVTSAPEMLECIATIYCLANLQPLLETKYSKALVNDIMKQMQQVLEKAGVK